MLVYLHSCKCLSTAAHTGASDYCRACPACGPRTLESSALLYLQMSCTPLFLPLTASLRWTVQKYITVDSHPAELQLEL